MPAPKSCHCLPFLMIIVFLCGCQDDRATVPEQTASADAVPQQTAGDQANSTDPRPLKFFPPPLTPSEIHDGWISLFDGDSLFGWQVPKSTNWRVEEHCIVADAGSPSLLTTPLRFDDFDLRCDFHLAAGGNSGVFLRTSEDPRDPSTDTYELNICDSHESFPTGSLVGRHRSAEAHSVEGAWHTFRIRCVGEQLKVWLDETPIVNFTEETDHGRSLGTIGLQMNGGRIAFRNILLRPLGQQPLFDGDSLNGWSVIDGSSSQFTVADGAIHVSDGPGFLQTDSVHADFILQLQARTNGTALNSGVFFRAQPGTADAPSHGYEMQVQNGYQNDDRTQPADAGTGAIFRRAAARYVVGNDGEWLTATLIAQGDRIATWVNGYQVVDWQDTRDPHENPRRGKRLAAGHLSLQGHDPTTDLDFREIRIHDVTSPR